MKALLRRMLGARHYTMLVGAKNRTLRSINSVLVGAASRLPDRSRLALKSGLSLVRRMDYARDEIVLAVESEMEYGIRLHSCAKEPETVEWIETSLREGDVLYDVGANVGAYSLVAAKRFRGKVAVYAFEPSFVNFPQLCRNVLLNRCERIITPLQLALSNGTGVEQFHYENLVPGGALHALGLAIDYKGDPFSPVFTQRILSVTIDDLVDVFRLPAPNHLKIDVDGTELAVLQGADRALKSGVVRSILIEIEGHSGEGIVQFLLDRGFVIASMHPYMYGGPTSRFLDVANWIFRRRE